MQETDAQSLLPGGWCLFPAGPYGRKPKLKLMSTLILSLLSQSSTPISEAPVHGEFESVRAQLLEGWDGGWDGTEDFISPPPPPSSQHPCSGASVSEWHFHPESPTRRLWQWEEGGGSSPQECCFRHTALQSPLATGPSVGSQDPEVPGNWQGSSWPPSVFI